MLNLPDLSAYRFFSYVRHGPNRQLFYDITMQP